MDYGNISKETELGESKGFFMNMKSDPLIRYNDAAYSITEVYVESIENPHAQIRIINPSLKKGDGMANYHGINNFKGITGILSIPYIENTDESYEKAKKLIQQWGVQNHMREELTRNELTSSIFGEVGRKVGDEKIECRFVSRTEVFPEHVKGRINGIKRKKVIEEEELLNENIDSIMKKIEFLSGKKEWEPKAYQKKETEIREQGCVIITAAELTPYLPGLHFINSDTKGRDGIISYFSKLLRDFQREE